MEQPILTDKDQYPTEAIIFKHIGASKKFWDLLFGYVHASHPDFSEEWRYYKDGKSWLMKVTRKSATIFWLSVIENAFRITFYFGDKAEQMIMESTISDRLKEQFRDGKRFGKIRGITINFKDPEDVESAKSLIAIKLNIRS